MTIATGALLSALFVVDAAGAVVAVRHRIAGEPFGIGGSLDVRRPAVLTLWGSGLSAPIASLVAAAALLASRPGALRFVGALFALGGLAEPVLWGRRPCPRRGRVLLVAHVAIATSLAAVASGRVV